MPLVSESRFLRSGVAAIKPDYNETACLIDQIIENVCQPERKNTIIYLLASFSALPYMGGVTTVQGECLFQGEVRDRFRALLVYRVHVSSAGSGVID